MKVLDDLNPHNKEAFQEITNMLEKGVSKLVASRATGSGKTYLMAALAEQYNDAKKLVLEPSNPLLDSIKGDFAKFGIKNTDFMTYQKLICLSDEDISALGYKLILLDECHHCAAPVWGEKIRHLMDTHLDSVFFGTSATSVRSDGVNVIDVLFEENVIGELPLSTAIAKGILPVPVYVTALYRLDDELEKLRKKVEGSTNTKDEKKEYLDKIKDMKSHFEKSYGVPIILNKYIKEKSGKYLVFCKDKKHLDAMRDVVIDWLRTAGIKDIHSYVIYSDYPDKEKDYKEFLEDNSSTLKILFSINMLNEGLHIKDISGVLMIRPTMSDIVYRQQLGRVLEVGNLGKHPLVFDLVNNFSSVNDGIGLLKEIKDAVAKEKENDPKFDDKDFVDIDTFFVIDQIMEIQGMFAEIEGELKGSWDLHIKALKQYKEREGDCLVPGRSHIEILDGTKIKLGQWCKTIRTIKNGTNKGLLDEDREKQLNQIGFIWDVPKYKFENNIRAIAESYGEYGKHPNKKLKTEKGRRLEMFLSRERVKMRNDNYPKWKMQIIKKYLPDFSSEKRGDKTFKQFIYYAELYKNKYGHVNIGESDMLNEFPIGRKYGCIKQRYKRKSLSQDEINQLEEMGILLKNKRQEEFAKKMNLAKQAVAEGITINSKNSFYKEINMQNWIQDSIKRRYINNELTKEEICVVEKLIGRSLHTTFCKGKIVKIIDVNGSKQGTICNSQCEVIRTMQEQYGTNICNSSVSRRLNGEITTPYKGRFMFYYATGEEVKKYLEDRKRGNQ